MRLSGAHTHHHRHHHQHLHHQHHQHYHHHHWLSLLLQYPKYHKMPMMLMLKTIYSDSGPGVGEADEEVTMILRRFFAVTVAGDVG